MTREGRTANKEGNRLPSKDNTAAVLSRKPGLEPTGIQGKLCELHSSYYEKEKNIWFPQKIHQVFLGLNQMSYLEKISYLEH